MQVMQELRRRQKAVLKDFKAREKKGKQLLRKIASHEKALETLKNELSELFDQSGAALPTVANPVLLRESGKARHVVAHRESQSKLECVKTILEKSRHAMNVSEIVKALQDVGYTFRSKNPVAALKVMLYTHKQLFKKVTPGCFAVACPAGMFDRDENGNTDQDRPSE